MQGAVADEDPANRRFYSDYNLTVAGKRVRPPASHSHAPCLPAGRIVLQAPVLSRKVPVFACSSCQALLLYACMVLAQGLSSWCALQAGKKQLKWLKETLATSQADWSVLSCPGPEPGCPQHSFPVSQALRSCA